MESTSETSFYSEDPSYQCKERMKNLKKSMTLDLEAPPPKKQKFSCLLSTPDLNMLKLASPELERLLIQQNSQVSGTTPTPSQYFPKNVTEEQESYVRGFVEALAELHGSKKSTGDEEDNNSCDSNDNSNSECRSEASTSMSSTSMPAQTNLVSSFNPGIINNSGAKLPVTIKEEPQTVPSRGANSPPMSPIDLVDQERIKLERKRLRNRLAATKCRQMKLEKISRLELKVKDLKNENDELGGLVTKLKDRICFLKGELMEHVNLGCKVMVPAEFLD